MIDHKTTILSIIKSYQGDANKRTQTQITEECISRGGVNITERATRKMLRELIDEGYPILSTPKQGKRYLGIDLKQEYIDMANKGIRKIPELLF